MAGIRKIYFEADKNKVIKARSIIYDWLHTADASTALTEIFGTKDQFDTPKLVELIKFLIKHGGDNNSIVLTPLRAPVQRVTLF